MLIREPGEQLLLDKASWTGSVVFKSRLRRIRRWIIVKGVGRTKFEQRKKGDGPFSLAMLDLLLKECIPTTCRYNLHAAVVAVERRAAAGIKVLIGATASFTQLRCNGQI